MFSKSKLSLSQTGALIVVGTKELVVQGILTCTVSVTTVQRTILLLVQKRMASCRPSDAVAIQGACCLHTIHTDLHVCGVTNDRLESQKSSF
jgi:hypothetical protein